MKLKLKFLLIFIWVICQNPIETASVVKVTKLIHFIRDFLINYNFQESITHDVVFLRLENQTSTQFLNQLIRELPKDNPVTIIDLMKNDENFPKTRQGSLVIIISDVYDQVSLSLQLKVKIESD